MTTAADKMRGAARVDMLDVQRVRVDFPALHQTVHGRSLVYLDNAATTQKPRQVIEALDRYYRSDNANVHRGVHALSERATAAYEAAREKVREFLNARWAQEIVFVRGTTEGINLVAQSWGRTNLRPDDEVIITETEHHSNIVPWQMLCGQTGAQLRVVPVEDNGVLSAERYAQILGERTRLVAVSHCSNALGTINPVKQMISQAHEVGALVLVDGAQAVAHLPVDVHDLDCDFYAFSGHKLYGPTGIGVLYAKKALLQEMPPYQGGGEMVKHVSFDRTSYLDPPLRFEAGTPDIAGAIGLGAAIDYVDALGSEAIGRHERELLLQATEAISGIPGLRIIGTAPEKTGILSFVLDGVHAHDVGTILDMQGVAVRVGHHCAMPVMQRYCVPATARASFALYNTREEVDALVAGIYRAKEVFG